jgi:lipopolysaccharide export system protein LptA
VLLLLCVYPFFTASVTALPDDANRPIEISSDTAEFDDKLGTAKHFGHVLMDQGSRHLEAETLIIERNAANKIEKITATGRPARFKTQLNSAKPTLDAIADTLIFYPEKQTLYLNNNAQVMQDNHRVEGNQLIYFLATKKLIAEFTENKRTTVIIPPRSSPQTTDLSPAPQTLQLNPLLTTQTGNS